MDKILIVDDEAMNREILASVFENQYEIIEAANGDEACDIIDRFRTDICVIFLDLIMPGRNGLDVLVHMRYRKLIDYIPVIMITGEATDYTDMKAYEYGAADIIYKPFSAKVVSRRASNLIELYKCKADMETEIRKQTKQIIKYQKEKDELNVLLLDALGSVVEFRSLETGDHVHRVMYFTKVILDYIRSYYPKYGLTIELVELMSHAAALHDIGKIAIPDSILNAPRKLTSEEFEEMKKHTVYGCDILKKFKIAEGSFYRYSYDICRWHHEKVDGRGYPDGLKGDEIPIYCQAVSLADCFDALVSKRVYKDKVAMDEAYDMIFRGECGAFSEEILDCFSKAKEEMFSIVRSYSKGNG